jgi:hypothetical protein
VAERDSLYAVAGVYGRRVGGGLQYDGERPSPDWHVHGYFSKRLWMLREGRLSFQSVRKRRWKRVGTQTTCHSRPPDDTPFVQFCTLIVVLKLWAWLSSGAGLHHKYQSLDPLSAGSKRTVQRWLRRSLPRSEDIQQAIRLAVIERSEPRPVERLFPRGLAPPSGLVHRGWKDPSSVVTLWRALRIAIAGSEGLSIPLTVLLAEARGRWSGHDTPFPI